MWVAMGEVRMSNGQMASDAVFTPIVTALETQVAQLDALGAHVAAAHLDAAIHQLRFDGLLAQQTNRV